MTTRTSQPRRCRRAWAKEKTKGDSDLEGGPSSLEERDRQRCEYQRSLILWRGEEAQFRMPSTL